MFRSPQQRLAFFHALKQKQMQGQLPNGQQPGMPAAPPIGVLPKMPAMQQPGMAQAMPQVPQPQMIHPPAPLNFQKLKRLMKPKF